MATRAVAAMVAMSPARGFFGFEGSLFSLVWLLRMWMRLTWIF